MRITHNMFHTHPRVVHFAGGHLITLTSAFRAYGRNAFARTPKKICNELTLLTWNNRSTNPEQRNLGALEESCGWFGQPVEVLGAGIRNFSLSHKISLTRELLARVSTPYVMAADSNDCLLLDYPVNLLREYLRHFSCDMVLAAGGNHPTSAELAAFELSLPWARSAPLPGVNSGSWIGRTVFVRECLNWCSKHQSHLENDQHQLRYAFRHFYPRIQIDYLRILFHRWSGWDDIAWEVQPPIGAS